MNHLKITKYTQGVLCYNSQFPFALQCIKVFFIAMTLHCNA